MTPKGYFRGVPVFFKELPESLSLSVRAYTMGLFVIGGSRGVRILSAYTPDLKP
ncbi:hypothetical protein Nos7524_1391 [Nostoc sp. PCC 7524]|nr:hypothetical protein Nos7524_1391 [Nostoc sp. PCC 7524]